MSREGKFERDYHYEEQIFKVSLTW